MQIFVHPLHGRERPIGSAFISYSRADEVQVENTILNAFDSNNIPYVMDIKDIGSEKTLERIRHLMENSSCGIVILSPKSMDSKWMWYETGVMEGLGKRILPFSLVSGSEKGEFIRSLPDFVRNYNVLDRASDLVVEVRKETFIHGVLARNPNISRETFAELKKVEINFMFDAIDTALASVMKFGVLIVKFGQHSALSQVSEALARRDGILINTPLPAVKRVDDSNENQSMVYFSIPVHKTLGVQLKFFVDVLEVEKIEPVKKFLKSCGVSGVSQSSSAEYQRIYFEVEHTSIPKVTSDDEVGITNNFIFPA